MVRLRAAAVSVAVAAVSVPLTALHVTPEWVLIVASGKERPGAVLPQNQMLFRKSPVIVRRKPAPGPAFAFFRNACSGYRALVAAVFSAPGVWAATSLGRGSSAAGLLGFT